MNVSSSNHLERIVGMMMMIMMIMMVTPSQKLIELLTSSTDTLTQLTPKGKMIATQKPVCTRLWCTNPESRRSGCSTRHMLWADGTLCSNPGANETMWCIRGQCVPKKIYRPVDGLWGSWSPYGPCSRTCGGGIKRATRLCNNPPPTNGGKFCTGRRIKYKSCNHMNCPPGSMDFREQQCRSFNGQHFNINGLSPNVQWVAKYSAPDSNDRCKLFCRDASSAAYYQLSERVIDGTKCSLDTTDVCVMGHCRRAGCDNRLGSSTARDNCGICGGDNSNCENVREKVSDDVRIAYGYNRITRIPRGSTNIDIRQISQIYTHDDDTYLALKNSSGDYILNGDFILSAFPKTVHWNSSVLEYTGSRHNVERINGTGPLSDDVEVYVLMVGEMLHKPHVEWQYTVRMNSSRSNKVFVWNKTVMKWSNCSHLCQGKKTRKVLCMNSATGAIVSDRHCLSASRKPSDPEKPCNTKCHLKWKVVNESECSAKCKEKGFIHREVQCLMEVNGSISGGQSLASFVDDKFCRHLNRPPALGCTGLCTSARWAYTSWSQCNKSCGGGFQVRTAFCQSDQGINLSVDACHTEERKVTEQRCNTDSCPHWSAGNWTQCSVSCGSGWKSREVICIQDDRVVFRTRCKTAFEPINKTKCSGDPCPAWHIGDVEPCSVTCGRGIQLRKIRCHSPQGLQINDDACDSGLRPRAEVTCMSICSVSVVSSTLATADPTTLQKPSLVMVWRTGSWTECSTSCGIGSRQRYVSCRDLSGNIAADSFCERMTKPAYVEQCKVQSCSVWRTGDWTQCSVTCGKGIETRFVACVTLEELEEQLLNPSQCDVSAKPPTERSCYRNDYCCLPNRKPDVIIINNVVGTAIWRAGPWSPCDVTCGEGYQHRMVHCQLPNGDILPDANCLEFAPSRRQQCALISCPVSTQRPRWQKGR